MVSGARGMRQWKEIKGIGRRERTFGRLVGVDCPDEDAFRDGVGNVRKNAEDVHVYAHLGGGFGSRFCNPNSFLLQ